METIENKVSDSSIKYSGKVTVSVVDNNGRVIKSYTNHNEGCEPLKNFLAACLAGYYQSANLLRPQYVRVFSLGAEGDDIPSVVYTDERTMTPVLADTTVKYDSTNHSATFKFMIPYSRLYLTTGHDINLYAIYGNQNVTTASTPSAYFIIKKQDDQTKLGKAFDMATAIASQNKLNLLIEWTMTLN